MGSSGMLTVKFFDKSWSIDVFFVDPGILFIPIAFPGNEELEFVEVDAAVKDVFKFIFQLPINDFWFRRGWEVSTRNQIFGGRKEFDDMEHQVKSSHRVWKFELVGIPTNCLFHRVEAEVAVEQLL